MEMHVNWNHNPKNIYSSHKFVKINPDQKPNDKSFYFHFLLAWTNRNGMTQLLKNNFEAHQISQQNHGYVLNQANSIFHKKKWLLTAISVLLLASNPWMTDIKLNKLIMAVAADVQVKCFSPVMYFLNRASIPILAIVISSMQKDISGRLCSMVL